MRPNLGAVVALFISFQLGACSQDKESVDVSDMGLVHEEFQMYQSYLVSKYDLPVTTLTRSATIVVDKINSRSQGIYFWANTIDVIPTPDPHMVVVTGDQNYYYRFLFGDKVEMTKWNVKSADIDDSGTVRFTSSGGEEIKVDTSSYGG